MVTFLFMPVHVESKFKKELLLVSPTMAPKFITKRNALECVCLKIIVPWLNLYVQTQLKKTSKSDKSRKSSILKCFSV